MPWWGWLIAIPAFVVFGKIVLKLEHRLDTELNRPKNVPPAPEVIIASQANERSAPATSVAPDLLDEPITDIPAEVGQTPSMSKISVTIHAPGEQMTVVQYDAETWTTDDIGCLDIYRKDSDEDAIATFAPGAWVYAEDSPAPSAVEVLQELLSQLPPDHQDRPGIKRSIEVLSA